MSNCTGLGSTLVFSSGITFTGVRWRSIDGIRTFVESLDDTALDSSGYMESCPDDLADTDPIAVEAYWDFAKAAPVGSVGTITITFALQPGQATPASITGTGYIVDASTPPLAPGQRLIGNLTIKFDGKTGPAFTPAA